MNSKERFEWLVKAGVRKPDEDIDVIKRLVNILIDALYIPVLDYKGINKVDPKRIKHFEIDDSEPINWGDLKCCEVKKFADGSYLVTIDEAALKYCETLCKYIEKHITSFGWKIQCETEW